MYKTTIRSWIKHADFILLDLFSLLLSLMTGIWVVRQNGQAFVDPNVIGLIVMTLMIDLGVLIAFDGLNRVVTRGYFVELGMTLRHVLLVLGIILLATLFRSEKVVYPRGFFFLVLVLYFLYSFGTRIFWKRTLRRHPVADEAKSPILIVTDSGHAKEILDRMRTYSFLRYQLVGFVFVDRDAEGEMFEDVPVVANLDNAADFLCRRWVDEVLFFHSSLDDRSRQLIEKCRQMALTIHLYVAVQGIDERKQTIGYIAGYEVLTANLNLMDPMDAFIKRSFDVVIGLLGSLAAGLLLVLIGPFIYAASPGPLIFRQERIGENGHKFKMYKIRSMYMDAEVRKAALAKESSHADGMMFKMDFDPRVIGNRILPDGTKKKGIGAFIRDTSLDEFPQFFNVLKGDMSVVGTRPPTPDEWEKYQYHHRARMSVKPGLTGMWQIRPDKDYMSFDDIVKLDTDYIANWGLGLDIRIIMATAKKFLSGLLPKRKEQDTDHRSEEKETVKS
jgi:exopolysaccharide biosynthesis polyprenyl glycosylphosphotransferase